MLAASNPSSVQSVFPSGLWGVGVMVFKEGRSIAPEMPVSSGCVNCESDVGIVQEGLLQPNTPAGLWRCRTMMIPECWLSL